MATRRNRPVGLTIVAALAFFVAFFLALLALLAFRFPTSADVIARTLPFVPLVSALPPAGFAAALAAFAALLAGVGIGLLRGHAWSWGAALALAAMSAAGDLLRVARRDSEGLLGLLIVGGMVAYLLRSDVRGWFRQEAPA